VETHASYVNMSMKRNDRTKIHLCRLEVRKFNYLKKIKSNNGFHVMVLKFILKILL